MKISEESISTHEHSLSYIHAYLMASVLEDLLLQIRIMTECNNELRLVKVMSDMKMLLSQKFNIQQPPATGELEVDRHRLWKEEYKLDKLVKDRNLVYNTILQTCRALIINRSYHHLVNVNTEIDEEKCYRDTLIIEEAKNKELRWDTFKQLRHQRNHHKTVLYDINEVIDKLKIKIEDFMIASECRSRYITHWEGARTSQHLLQIANNEEPPLETITTYKRKVDDEETVHTNIMLLIKMNMSEILEQVESTMTKYEEDMNSIDLAIQRMNIKFQDAVDKRIELEETYAKHEQLAKDWERFKEERENARLYREKLQNAAFVIQAWWRGILVRNQLGPYTPKKKRGRAKKI